MVDGEREAHIDAFTADEHIPVERDIIEIGVHHASVDFPLFAVVVSERCLAQVGSLAIVGQESRCPDGHVRYAHSSHPKAQILNLGAFGNHLCRNEHGHMVVIGLHSTVGAVFSIVVVRNIGEPHLSFTWRRPQVVVCHHSLRHE